MFFFFGSSYLPGVRASLKYKRKASYHRHSELAVYKKWIYIRDHELRAQVRTIWECNSVSQDNPLDTRLQNQLSFTPVCLLVARLPWDRANHYTSHVCYRHGQHRCIRYNISNLVEGSRRTAVSEWIKPKVDINIINEFPMSFSPDWMRRTHISVYNKMFTPWWPCSHTATCLSASSRRHLL